MRFETLIHLRLLSTFLSFLLIGLPPHAQGQDKTNPLEKSKKVSDSPPPSTKKTSDRSDNYKIVHIWTEFSGKGDWMKGSVSVSRKGGDHESYLFTDRKLDELVSEYTKEFLNPDKLRGKRVLDLCTGGGSLPRQLRYYYGVNAFGLDIVIEPLAKPFEARSLEDLENEGKAGRCLIRRDAANTGLQSNSFDYLYSSWGVYSYEGGNQGLMEQVFKESHRILKPGGSLTLTPIHTKDAALFDRILKTDFKGFKIVKHRFSGDVPIGGKPKGPAVTLEIRKE
jgi:ubiquinone/menaquinone biosynthesis C-methylase UbiE